MIRTLTTIAWMVLAVGGFLQATASASADPDVEKTLQSSLDPGEVPDPRRASRRLAADPISLTTTERQLIKRPERVRSDKPLSIPLFGRLLTFGGRYTVLARSDTHKLLDFDFFNFDKNGQLKDVVRGNVPTDDQLRVNQTMQIDMFYPLAEDVSVYLESRAEYRKRVWADHADSTGEWIFERSESWLYLGNLFDTPFGLQAGRQRFAEEREWWWDEDLDAIRLRFDQEKFHAEVAVAEQLFRLRFDEPIDPEDEDILQILGTASWEWAAKQQIGLYAIHRHDHSSRQERVVKSGLCVPEDRIPPQIPPDRRGIFRAGCPDPVSFTDESDADLTWFGVSAAGSRKFGRAGRLDYWLDTAWVSGKETFTDYSGPTGNEVVGTVNRHRVSGWGIDARASWESKLPGRLSLTLGYAFGSGKKNMLELADRGFRQTGLQDNSQKFRGAQSFRYYGELLDPELSNLRIATAGLGVRFLHKSSLDIVYHHYRQAKAAPFLRDVGFKRDPDGRHRSIGQEIDVIVGIREWKLLEFKLVGAIFRPGKAFFNDVGDLSYFGALRVRLNF